MSHHGIHQHMQCSVSFTGEISPDGEFFFENANFGDFFSKTHFLIAKFFIRFDPFSSI
jgi:hypothetical protein